MNPLTSRCVVTALVATVIAAVAPSRGHAQVVPRKTAGQSGPAKRAASAGMPESIRSRDSVAVVANGRFDAGEVHRFFMGDTYRDVWGQPIKVPIVDLDDFAGGLKPTEEGGGNQTRSLRFASSDGREWTFRPVIKDKLSVILAWEGTPIMDLFRDGLSGSFPAAPVVSPAILQAAGIVHPKPQLVVLPDNDQLGEFRKDFAGRLGTIEEHVGDGDSVPLFRGAVRIIDSDDLLKLMNEKPRRHIDPRTMLKARLVDILLGDTDRHRDQWKWGLMEAGDSLYTPIPRDRDQVLATHDGALLRLARIMKPYLVVFDSTYPKVETMVGYARDLDDRMLAELSWATWDSVATELTHSITDSVIHAGITSLPEGYHPLLGAVEGKLRARRDALPAAARDYYGSLALMVNVHATDADDRALVERSPDGSVLVTLGEPAAPWFSRRFVSAETKEVRVYLHGGDDRAEVVGTSGPGITVRVVGGGGTNALVDSSRRVAHGALTRLYDKGNGRKESFEPDSAFNRLPWLHVYGAEVRPARDRGSNVTPLASLNWGHGLGLVPGLGIRKYRYGFRSYPYRSVMGVQAQYSTAVNGFRVLAQGDLRPPATRVHVGGEAEMTQLALVHFNGLSNESVRARDAYHEIRQRQWIARPWTGYAFGLNSDVTLGPVLKYVQTDSVPNTYLAATQPFGTGDFGQLGLELRLKHDTRDNPANPLHGFFTELTGSSYAGVWSARAPFHRIAASASTYIPMPLRKNAVLALRAGGEKVLGDFPYYEAAFLGGGKSLRAVHYHQLAGDASIFGNAELRVPIARVPLILPWDIGLLGYGETGRVYVAGDSPGGWHRAVGGGFWLGILGPAAGVSVLYTNSRERQWMVGTGVSF
ncbi:MAG: BamA/TamA family outer membrane protein [Gemmatimonadaceae bacterium]